MEFDELPEDVKQKRLDALKSLADIGEQMREAYEKIKEEQEQYWNNLSKDQQLDLFCCVVRRLVDGELKDKGSYRYILYDVFGFGMESYALALDAGFMSLHNSIFSSEEEKELVDNENEACARIVEACEGLTPVEIAAKIRARKDTLAS